MTWNPNGGLFGGNPVPLPRVWLGDDADALAPARRPDRFDLTADGRPLGDEEVLREAAVAPNALLELTETAYAV